MLLRGSVLYEPAAAGKCSNQAAVNGYRTLIWVEYGDCEPESTFHMKEHVEDVHHQKACENVRVPTGISFNSDSVSRGVNVFVFSGTRNKSSSLHLTK